MGGHHGVRRDSVLIQQLEENMLSHFHTDVLMALQVTLSLRGIGIRSQGMIRINMISDMISDMITFVLLQPMAHGHETTISVKGLNGVVLESTFTEEKTADFLDRLSLDRIRDNAMRRESYRMVLERRTS